MVFKKKLTLTLTFTRPTPKKKLLPTRQNSPHSYQQSHHKQYHYRALLLHHASPPKKMIFHGVQLSDNNPFAPALPPDFFCDPMHYGTIQVDDIHRARMWNHALSDVRNNRRKYIFGSCYHKLLGNDYLVLDAREFTKSIQINIKQQGDGIHYFDNITSCGAQAPSSTIKIFDARKRSNLLQKVVLLGDELKRNDGSCVRGTSTGDQGKMHALGVRDKFNNVHYVNNKKSPNIKQYMKRLSKWTVRYMNQVCPEVLSDIQKAESNGQKFEPIEFMMGADGPGSSIMISRNLQNASHYDVNDNSMSFGVWAEKDPNKAKNWYFVCPNVCIGRYRGLVIQLFHGCGIVWDGRVIRHCTSKTDVGDGNDVYGCMFGSCR